MKQKKDVKAMSFSSIIRTTPVKSTPSANLPSQSEKDK